MKIFYLLLAILLCAACGESRKPGKAEEGLSLEDTTAKAAPKPKLDSTLVAGVKELVKNKAYLKYPDIPLNESFIAIIFRIDTLGLVTPGHFSDSIIDITYKVYGRYDKLNYKGVIDIDSIHVAIFDIGNFGGEYYNPDSLSLIPLDSFKRYPMKAVVSNAHILRDGQLHRLN